MKFSKILVILVSIVIIGILSVTLLGYSKVLIGAIAGPPEMSIPPMAMISAPQNPEVAALSCAIADAITEQKQTSEKFSNYQLLLTFLTTIFGGLVTMISSISMVRNGSISKLVGITIAVLTFVITLLSYGQSEVSSFKEKSEARVQEITKIRDKMDSLETVDDATLKSLQHEFQDL